MTDNDLKNILKIKNLKRNHIKHRNLKAMAVKTKARKTSKMYLNSEEMLQLQEEVKLDKAINLHNWYSILVDETNIELTDEFMASKMGWTARSVQKYRRVLEKCNWFQKIKTVSTDGAYAASYYLLDKETILTDKQKLNFYRELEDNNG